MSQPSGICGSSRLPHVTSAGADNSGRTATGPSALGRVQDDVDEGTVQVARSHAREREFVTRLADPGRDRFWRSHLALGFAILAGESAVATGYFLTSPAGAHRVLLAIIAMSVVAVGLAGVATAGWVARQAWRGHFLLFFAVGSAAALALCAGLDGGLESPLLYLSVLPVAYSSLALRLRAVAVAGVATTALIVLVGLTDPSVDVPQESLSMFSAFVIGVVILAMFSARERLRLQADDERLMQQLAERGVVDELTGCRNHRAFTERLAEEVARAQRYGRPLALIVCDVDLFKDFNDAHGHDVGDQALAAVGAHLRSAARSSDVVARIGGDEFAVLMAETSLAEARVVADRIVTASAAGTIPQPSLSVGIAALDQAEPTAKRLYRDADQAMYVAKASGRHRSVTAGTQRRSALRVVTGHASESCPDGKRAAEAVRRAEQDNLETGLILDVLMRESPVGFSFVDRDLNIVRMNPTLAAARELPLSELVGRPVSEAWPELEPLYRRVLDDGKALRDVELTLGDGTQAWLANLFPVRVRSRIIGVGSMLLDITDRKRLERSDEVLSDAVISALAAAAEARDPYTAGHQRRVAQFAGAIASELGYDAFTVRGIEVAAAIHDIGKVAVPAEILSRPGKLSAAELEIVRTHAEAGYNILRDIKFPWPIADMVHQHHERLDGSGYPQGLSGEQISLGGRIIAVADVVEAMASHRPYRTSLGIDVALKAINEGRDVLFDGKVVDACIRLFDFGILHTRDFDSDAAAS